jgi:hypothetical protein
VVTLSRLAAAVTCNEEIVRFTSLTDAQLALQALPSVVMADAVSGFELEWTKRHAETSSVVTAFATRFVTTARIISDVHTVSHPMQYRSNLIANRLVLRVVATVREEHLHSALSRPRSVGSSR